MLLVGAVLLAAVPVLDADIELPDVPPPQPKSLNIEVYKGESVDIPLEGVNRSGYQLRFLIRKQPDLGTLSAPRISGRTTATVTYTHDIKSGLGVDRFRYAVQTSRSGVSTPADVVVNVVERPPRFVAPTELEFDPTAIGEFAGREMELRNDGGSRVFGTMKLPAPWKIVSGGDSYDLGPGESQNYVLLFEPTEEKRYSGVIEFSHDPSAAVGLGGAGFAPISVVPREVRADSDGMSEVRTGAFIVRNESDVDREVRIEAPQSILVEDVVAVPAKSEVQVALHTKTGFLEGLSGTLHITGGSVDLKVPLDVAAAPVRLTANVREIDFGSIAEGRSAYAKFVVRNNGGSTADLRFTLPDGVEIRPDPTIAALEPGDIREFEISIARQTAGDVEVPLIVEAGISRLEIPLRLKVVEGPKTRVESPGKTAHPGGRRIKTNDIPPVSSLRVTRQTEHEIDFSWDKTSPSVAKYVVFLRTTRVNENNQAVYRYKKLDRVKVRFVRDEARTSIQGLRPGEQFTIQIVGYDAADVPSVASEPFVLASKPAKPVRIPWSIFGLVGLAIAAGVIVFERRRARRIEEHV